MMKYKRNALAVLTAMALTLGMHTAVFGAEPQMQAGSITVNGSGMVAVKPDLATIHLYVEHTAKTAADAQKQVNTDVAKVIAALQKLGATKEDIKTSQLSVHPSYQYEENGNRTLLGYRAYTSVDAKTRDIDQAGKWMDVGLHAGATGTDGVTFSLEDMAQHYNKALQEAVRVAQSSAQAIANAYGKTLKDVAAVMENSQNMGMYENHTSGARSEAKADAAPQAAGGGTQVSYEDIMVEANISVIYAF